MSNVLTFAYNANGGGGAAGSSASTFSPSSYPYTATKTVQGGTPSRLYYDFLGWSISSVASSPSYYNGSNYNYTFNANNQTATVTFYAVWRHQYVTVTYNANGGSGAPQAYTGFKGYAMTIPSTVPTRTGYTFLGWSTDSTATTASYTSGQEGVYFYSNTALYAVWRANASSISASNGTLGTALTISIARENNSYTDTITYQYGNAIGAIATKTSNPTVTWAPPLTLASEFPSATSGACTLTCSTYDGDTLLGTSSVTIALSIPSTIKVGLSSVALEETVAGLAAAFGAFVQTKSKVSVTAMPDTTNAYGATPTAYSININGQTLSGNGSVTDVLISNGTNNYSVTVTDSRGRTSTYSGTYNVLAYSEPTAFGSASRDVDVPTSIDVSYQFAVSSLNNQNTKSIKIYYKLRTASTYVLSTTITPGNYSGNGTYTIIGTTATLSYDIKIEVIDYFATNAYTLSVAAAGNRVFHISSTDGTIVIDGYNASDGDHHVYEHLMRFHAGIALGSTGLTEAELQTIKTNAGL